MTCVTTNTAIINGTKQVTHWRFKEATESQKAGAVHFQAHPYMSQATAVNLTRGGISTTQVSRKKIKGSLG